MNRKAAAMLTVAVLCGRAEGVTWEFETDGRPGGWYARVGGIRQPGAEQYGLPSAVADGVWRVDLAGLSARGDAHSVSLVSPEIGLPSALFDRIEVRFRVVGTSPSVGSLVLTWTNQDNRLTPGLDPELHSMVLDGAIVSRFSWPLFRMPVTWTTDWQEVVLSGFATHALTVWEGELVDVRLEFAFAAAPPPGLPGLELDRITLTGVEEELTGERSPPASPDRPLPGFLFGSPQFVDLELRAPNKVVLGDADADGDIDAVLRCHDEQDSREAIRIVRNEGAGRFALQGWSLAVAQVGSALLFDAADVNGDGRLDLFVGDGMWESRLLLGSTEGYPTEARVWGMWWLRRVADVDGDGDVDAGFIDLSDAQEPLAWALNDGHGSFHEVVLRGVPTQRLLLDVGDLAYAGDMLLIRTPPLVGHEFVRGQSLAVYQVDAGYELLTGDPEHPLEFRQSLALAVPPTAIALLGDLDLDGAVDAVASDTSTASGASGSMAAYLNDGQGSFARQASWLPAGFALSTPGNRTEKELWLERWDLDGDGVLDMALVDANARTGTSILVLSGRQGGLPVVEGQYAAPGAVGYLDAADMDGDGDLDLVAPAQDGGLHLLRNLLGERGTAVRGTMEASLPAGLRVWGPVPNPFNPSVQVRMAVSQRAHVTVAVYNVLGQRVRQVVDAVLPAGDHWVRWDGRGEAGEEVPSAVYLLRIDAGGDTQVIRAMKTR
ncbi:MAG: FG-GAP-like repeat-containing protein [Candidatus Latescibacterota bacterium]